MDLTRFAGNDLATSRVGPDQPRAALLKEELLPVNTYEGMFLLDSTKAAAAWDDTVKQVHDILLKYKSEIVASRQWDERRLAYPTPGQLGTGGRGHRQHGQKQAIGHASPSGGDPPGQHP